VLDALLMPDEPLPRLLLLDGHMPVMDGWEVIEAFRAQRSFHGMQVVLLSGNIAATQRKRMEQWGVWVINKPVSFSDTERLFRELMKGNRPAGPGSA